ncbi:hypothetical protein J2W51_003796 [Tardiphaga robiniae]|uniref:hypothetical protein n=1 Tax=Tardiphaga robiniae TaxID=943830 RepID=UPI0028589B28|nr:hypothetical protein [Tardiphaga robiniae]MDR6661210.1 hypothetical protein [Tardiphaga robiniae]
MECPFCTETIRDEAIACKNCSRDLRFVRPILLEVQDLVSEIDNLTHALDRAEVALARLTSPLRYYVIHFAVYVLLPAVLLVAAHIVITIVLNIAPLYLRLASIVIPLLFGIASMPFNKLGPLGAWLVGLVTAILSVGCMLVVTGINDSVPIVPASVVEWREVGEYVASISLAFLSGNVLGMVIFRILPNTLAQGGKPNAIAFKAARLLGEHVGGEQMRRRARLIQEFAQTAGPLLGAGAGVAGSLYTGLKGVIGS